MTESLTPAAAIPEAPALGRESLERLYVELEKPMYNVVYRWVWDAEEAHGIVQEAFVRLWAMRNRVRMDTVRPLVYRIALNLASKRRRTLRLWHFVGLAEVWGQASADRGALGTVEARAATAAVRKAVDALPEHQRQVVMLTELGELSHAEVAEALGIPVGTVGSRRHAALRRLREDLGDWESGRE